AAGLLDHPAVGSEAEERHRLSLAGRGATPDVVPPPEDLQVGALRPDQRPPPPALALRGFLQALGDRLGALQRADRRRPVAHLDGRKGEPRRRNYSFEGGAQASGIVVAQSHDLPRRGGEKLVPDLDPRLPAGEELPLLAQGLAVAPEDLEGGGADADDAAVEK